MPANLLDIIGEYETPKLTRTEHSYRSNTSELKLRAEVSKLISSYCLDLAGFNRELEEWLQETSMGNSTRMWTYYQIKSVGAELEIWHTNAKGNPDRLIVTISPKQS